MGEMARMAKMNSVCNLEKRLGQYFVPKQAAPANTAQTAKPTSEQKPGYKDRFWIPRFWDGMCLVGWLRLLVKNRCAVSLNCIGMALIISLVAVINAFLWLIQTLLFGRRIARTKIEHDPIFVIGHWRSGTTLLHELLVGDRRHTYPDTYACFAPNHFLASGWWMKPCLKVLLPSRRPTDNMPAGWDHPQEDEFALCNMGVPSPYLTIAFSNRPPQCQEYVDFRGVDPPALNRWKQAMLWFLKCITLHDPKRIVLKSPPHTGRIRVLLEMFPKAKFVHIVRDPYVIFPSTVNLWKRLYCDEGLQKPTYKGLEEHVFTTFTRMYEAFERDRDLIGPGQFCEVRYEDLVANPVGEMRRVYEELALGDFESARPGVEAYLAGQKGYKTNRYQMPPELRAEIARRWGKFIRKHGYAKEEVDSRQSVVST
jgi:omega-hydroxy-beta-dihydromenaquinone-9 sulfotransferase